MQEDKFQIIVSCQSLSSNHQLIHQNNQLIKQIAFLSQKLINYEESSLSYKEYLEQINKELIFLQKIVKFKQEDKQFEDEIHNRKGCEEVQESSEEDFDQLQHQSIGSCCSIDQESPNIEIKLSISPSQKKSTQNKNSRNAQKYQAKSSNKNITCLNSQSLQKQKIKIHCCLITQLSQLQQQKYRLKYSQIIKHFQYLSNLQKQLQAKQYLIESYQKQFIQMQKREKLQKNSIQKYNQKYREEMQKQLANLTVTEAKNNFLSQTPTRSSSSQSPSLYYMKQYLSLEQQMKKIQSSKDYLEQEKIQLQQKFIQMHGQIDQLLIQNQKLQKERLLLTKKLQENLKKVKYYQELEIKTNQKIQHYEKVIQDQGKCLVQKFNQNKNLEKIIHDVVQKKTILEKVNSRLSQTIENWEEDRKIKELQKFQSQQIKNKQNLKPLVNQQEGNPENEKNKNTKGNKSYLIRTTFNDYINELIDGLINMGGMNPYEIQQILGVQLISFTRFFNDTMKQKIKDIKKQP